MSRPSTPLPRSTPTSPLATTPPRTPSSGAPLDLTTPPPRRLDYDAAALASPTPSHLRQTPTRQYHLASPRTPVSSRGGRHNPLDFTVDDSEKTENLELDEVQPHSSPFHDSKIWKKPPSFSSPTQPQRRSLTGSPRQGIQAEVDPERDSSASESSSSSAITKKGWKESAELGLSNRAEMLDAFGIDLGDEVPVLESGDAGYEEPRHIPKPSYHPPAPTIPLFFRQLTQREMILFVLPAFILCIAAGIVPPAMTYLIGQAFGTLAEFPVTYSDATAADKSAVISGVSKYSLWLTVLGAAGLTVNTLMMRAWIGLAERIVDRLRTSVYSSVMNRGLVWFDMGMGMKKEGDAEVGEDSIGAGGLMAKFTRETDDVRQGAGRHMALSVQSFFTFIFCLILAFWKQWSLTLVILSAVPVAMLVQLVSERYGNPLYNAEKMSLAQLSTNLERTTNAIGTVKAFNAQAIEAERFAAGVKQVLSVFRKQTGIWAVSFGTVNGILLMMFVAGFWFGAELIGKGKATTADVMTVFWACMLGSSSFQMLVPQMVFVTRGQVSMSALIALVEAPSPEPKRETGMYISSPLPVSENSTPTGTPVTPGFPVGAAAIPVGHKPTVTLRRLNPTQAKGEINLQNVTFAYPSRPDNLVLDEVSMFLPAGEMTFIVGGSGSGKSTVAQLLLRLYEPLGGVITMDDQDLRYLDMAFTREHVGAVQQGCVMFDMSVHDNVSMGLAGLSRAKPSDATRKQVIDSCTMAMLHDFIISLPDGYDTSLGAKGSALSGGQKQRLAIARARLRDPTLLILDECTSALDATSRILVFKGIKKWRKNRTTIVITHDLSQIMPEDFVYLMKDGHVVEQGFRSDLISRDGSVFGNMATEQAVDPLPEDQRPHWTGTEEAEEILEMVEGIEKETVKPRPTSMILGGIADQEGLGYLDILSEYSRRTSAIEPRPSSIAGSRTSRRFSVVSKRMSIRSTADSPIISQNGSPNLSDVLSKHSPNLGGALARSRLSYLQAPASPQRPVSVKWNRLTDGKDPMAEDQASVLDRPPTRSTVYNPRWSAYSGRATDAKLDIVVEEDDKKEEASSPPAAALGILQLLRIYLPGLPGKHYLFLGILMSAAHGIAIPLWSKYLATLMAGATTASASKSEVTTSVIVIAITVADAIFSGGQYWFLHATSSGWLAVARNRVFGTILKQEQAWFDQRENQPTRLVQLLIKDGDDMRPLFALVFGRSLAFLAMILLGFGWSLAIGWQFTLVGLAVAPIFAILMILQTRLVNSLEIHNKADREQVAKTLYESVANIRGIRAMALDEVFEEKYQAHVTSAYSSGCNAAWAAGAGTGSSMALPYFVQAMMIFVSSIFMAKGIVNYESMLQVYSLVLFSVTYAAQMLEFIPDIAKARMAAADFLPLHRLTTDNQETRGDLRFPIEGNVKFEDVHFTYPTRPDVPILQGVSFTLKAGECVAIVGPSGSGKSTIASLLQRLYEPARGGITLDRHSLKTADVKWLREHVGVVSQQAVLFDATVTENISYGSTSVPMSEIHRAAQAAHVHDFIMSLPKGYDTNLGENASLISGGQAQRLQIARALIRRSNILILDECTSALDPENQRAVLDTIMKLKETRTTIFVTHKADVMKRCDRVLCLSEGRIAEDGSYDDLVKQRGVFAKLMQAGEWE